MANSAKMADLVVAMNVMGVEDPMVVHVAHVQQLVPANSRMLDGFCGKYGAFSVWEAGA